jgi:hypothetical protein
MACCTSNMHLALRTGILVVAQLLVPAFALAQNVPTTPAAAAAAAARANANANANGNANASPAGAPTADSTATTAGSSAPADDAAPAHVVVPATGYGWSDPKKPSRAPSALRAPRRAAKRDAPEATMPGFETLGDGSSRLFVELSRPTHVDTKTGQGKITYVLKGAYVTHRNNYNPLVTIHFNTPVSDARLVPHGSDLWFVVQLRANAQPTLAVDTTKDGGAMVRIEFPRGDYLRAGRAREDTSADTSVGH